MSTVLSLNLKTSRLFQNTMVYSVNLHNYSVFLTLPRLLRRRQSTHIPRASLAPLHFTCFLPPTPQPSQTSPTIPLPTHPACSSPLQPMNWPSSTLAYPLHSALHPQSPGKHTALLSPRLRYYRTHTFCRSSHRVGALTCARLLRT